MSRAAVYSLLLSDPRLIDLGLDQDSLLVNYDGEQRPSDNMFLVLGWGAEDTLMRGDDVFSRGVKALTIWVHIYRKMSTDFSRIDAIIKIIDDILFNAIHVEGDDGYTLTCAEPTTHSSDMRDDSYETICRSVSYRILSRESATV